MIKALSEAAERFKELQTEREMRQLQEDRKNDKKPPPYRHIKVSSHAELCFYCEGKRSLSLTASFFLR